MSINVRITLYSFPTIKETRVCSYDKPIGNASLIFIYIAYMYFNPLNRLGTLTCFFITFDRKVNWYKLQICQHYLINVINSK